MPFVNVNGAVMLMLGHLGLTSSESGSVPKQPFTSVALTVNGNVPVCAGVPERTPAFERLIPAGRAGVTRLQVTAPTPPVWERLTAVYAMPEMPGARLTGAIVIEGQVTPIPSGTASGAEHPFASVAVTLMLKTPVAAGVP